MRQRNFTVVITDVRLPDAAGLVVLDRLESLAGVGTPILILCNDAPAPEIYSRAAAVMVKTRTAEDRIVATILQAIDYATEAGRNRARVRHRPA